MTTAKIEIRASDRTKKAFSSVNKRLRGMGSILTSTQAKVGALVGAAGMGALVATQFRAVDVTSRWAGRMGIANEELGKLTYAMGANGAAAEDSRDVIKDLSEKVADAARNGGEYDEVLSQIGLNSEQLVNLPIDEQFYRVADGIANMKNEGDQAYVSMTLMSDAGYEVLDAMTKGSDSLRKAGEEAEAFNYALSGVDAAKVQAANASLRRTWMGIQGMGNTIAVELAGPIEDVSTLFGDAIRDADGFQTEIRDLGQTAIKWTADGMDAVGAGVQFIQTHKTMAEGGLIGLAFFGTKGLAIGGLIGQTIDELKEKLGMTERPAMLEALEATEQSLERTKNRLATLDDELSRNRFFRANPLISTEALQQEQAELTEHLKGLQEKHVELWQKLQSDDEYKKYYDGLTQEGENAFNKLAAKLRESLGKQQEIRDEAASSAAGGSAAVMPGFEDGAGDRLAKLRESLTGERETLRMHFEERSLIVEDAFQQGLIRETERKQMLEQLTAEHQSKITAIERKGWTDRQKFAALSMTQQAGTIFGEMANITAGVAQHNKQLFEINKVAGVANAVIGAHEGASKTLAKYPYPVGPALAALHYAAGLARVQAIKSTSFAGGGGGTTPSAAGSAPTVNSQPVQAAPQVAKSPEPTQPQSQIQVIVEGNVVGNEDFQEQVVEAIRDAQDRERL